MLLTIVAFSVDMCLLVMVAHELLAEMQNLVS